MRRDYGPDVGVKNMKGPRDAAPPSNIRAPLAGFGLSVKRKERADGNIGRPPGGVVCAVRRS